MAEVDSMFPKPFLYQYSTFLYCVHCLSAYRK